MIEKGVPWNVNKEPAANLISMERIDRQGRERGKQHSSCLEGISRRFSKIKSNLFLLLSKYQVQYQLLLFEKDAFFWSTEVEILLALLSSSCMDMKFHRKKFRQIFPRRF